MGLDHDLTVTQSTGGTLNITQAHGADATTGFDIKGFTATLQADGNINVSGTIYNSTGSGGITIGSSACGRATKAIFTIPPHLALKPKAILLLRFLL